MTRKSALKPQNRPRTIRHHPRTGQNPAGEGRKPPRTAVRAGSEPAHASWQDLSDELDRWAKAGRIASFWWRDDDAEAPSPALERLLALADATLPLSLAVIPAHAGPGLAARLAHAPHLSVLQHGWSHANHAPANERTIELGAHRPAAYVLAELADGRQRLARLFGRRFLPVIVPPWNRIAPAIARALPGRDFSGLSSRGARAAGRRGSTDSGDSGGFAIANVHIDVLHWRPRARFIGDDLALGQAVRHLAARRRREADPDEPTGLMTHHRQHDSACWRFLERFLALTSAHPAVRYLPAAEIFAPVRAATRPSRSGRRR